MVILGSLTGQYYVDGVLHPHVMTIYWTVGNSFLFQQDSSPIPAIWRGIVRKLVLNGLLDPDPSQSNTPGTFKAVGSIPSNHITRIVTPAGLRMATHSTEGGYKSIPRPWSTSELMARLAL